MGGKAVETSKDAGRLTDVLGGDEVGLFCVDTCKVLLWEEPPGGRTQAGLQRGRTDRL